jgi:hypothetical protein
MKQSAQQNPDRGQPQRNRTTKIVVPGVMDTTATQLGILLNAMNGLLPYVMKGSALHFPGADGHPIEMDGSAVEAASATVINITTRIDKILSDEERWDLAHVKHATEQINAIASKQQAALDSALRPCMQLRPTLGFSPVNASWVAVYQAEDGLVPLVGIGASPDDALKSFDEQFTKIAKAYENTMDPRDTGGTPPKTQPGNELPGTGDSIQPLSEGDREGLPSKRFPRRSRRKGGDDAGGGQGKGK